MASTSNSSEEMIDEMFRANYCDEEHMQAFARALNVVDDEHDVPGSPLLSRSSFRSTATNTPPASSSAPNGTGSANPAVPRHLQHTRVRKVSAVSDFAPIHTKVKRASRLGRHGPKPRPSIKSEPLYVIFRWPILILLNTVIAIEFGCYVFIRQLVNAFEWFLAWRGPKRTLRSHLRKARTWEEWKVAASVLDEYLGFNQWKEEEEDPYYDYKLVRKVRRSLRTLRQNNDVHGTLELLEVCLRDNFAGTQSARLYAESFYGTKNTIEDLVSEMEAALAFIRQSPDISLEEKRRFYRHANRNLGSSALCLSGGASFGFYHFGVVKALLDANLLPRVYNGTSAGTLAAAFACTHTDEEMRLLMGPRLADCITCFEEPFSTIVPRFFKTGAMFEAVQWARKATWFTRGSMTFREAYERTGKVLNISVIPADQHSPTKLLNYLTAPNCVIWSAAIASSAVPTIINPVVLMEKTRTGAIVPWNWGAKFKDGSLRVDVPLQSLNLLFNVNYPIVSQVNPHIHLFWFAPRGSAGKPVAHRKGKGWRGGFLLSAAEQFLKLELTKNFKVIRDLELMPQILGQDWSCVFLQRFDGSITVHPRIQFKDFLRMLTDPDRPNMERMMRAGELATWPTLHMIENRFRLEREIFRGRLAVRQQSLGTQDMQRDAAAPDMDPNPIHPRLEGGLGAPPSPNLLFTAPSSPPTQSNGAGPSTPRPDMGTMHRSTSKSSQQLAIESEAEEDFESRSPSLFANSRPRSMHRSGGNGSAGSSKRQSRRASPELRRFARDGGDDEGLPSPSSFDRNSRKNSGATLRALRTPPSANGNGSGNTSGSGNPSAASTTAQLISRLRHRSFPRLGGLRRSIHPRHADGEEDDTTTSSEEEEDDARGKGTMGGVDTLALPDAWSSDDSFDDPAFSANGSSLERSIEHRDEDVLEGQAEADAAGQPVGRQTPEQDT